MIPRLCFIADSERGSGGRPLEEVVLQALAAGAEMVIVRERGRSDAELSALLDQIAARRPAGCRVLVSRRLDLVRACGLDGVHLAADAVPLPQARAWLGPEALIGYSAHSAAEARRAAEEGASYVTLSPIYPTGSKPGAAGRGAAWLARATGTLPIPVLALGGMTPARVQEVRAAGAWGVAAVSAIGAAPKIEEVVQEFRRALG
ncbi:MAG: thiamine phosphate synthase [Myxococcota bacterium]